MQLRFTKGVGIALAIAAGCAVLGFVMAPGWWFFGAYALLVAALIAGGAKFQAHEASECRSMAQEIDEEHRYNPSYRNTSSINIWSE